MDPDDLRAFVDRPWDELRESKRAFAVERARRDPEAARRISRALAARIREIRGRGPTHEERSDDLETHIRVKALIDSVAHVFCGAATQPKAKPDASRLAVAEGDENRGLAAGAKDSVDDAFAGR